MSKQIGHISLAAQQQHQNALFELRVGNKYKIGRKIGSGSFGDIYLGLFIHSLFFNKFIGTNIVNGEEVAIKIESYKAKHPQLEYEARVYKSLAGGGRRFCFFLFCLYYLVGIPFVRWFGQEGEYLCMVIDLLGPSLEDLFNFCGRKFTLKTVLLLADQLVYLEIIIAQILIHYRLQESNIFIRKTFYTEISNPIIS